MHRLDGEQIGFDGERIGIGHIRITGVRHRGVQLGVAATDAFVDGVQEIRIGIAADSGFRIRGNVGRINRSKRQNEGEAAGERSTVFCRMAHRAIRRTRQVFSALDQARRFELRGGAGGILGLVRAKRNRLATRKARGLWAQNDIRADDDAYANNRCEGPENRMLFHAAPDFGNGSMWMRLPVAAKMALATAGPTGATPGSPTPVGGAVEGTMYTSTLGISFMRSTR